MLSNEQKQFFEENGYLKLEGILSPELVKELRTEAEKLVATEPQDVSGRIWHERALFRRPVFRRVLDLQPLIEAEQELLGNEAQLLALDLLMTRPGRGGIGWHRDVGFVCNKTLSINTGMYLQDMTSEAGPLRVVPGSHRWEASPDHDGTPEGAIEIPSKAGDAVLFDAGLWHAGNTNNAAQDRLGVFAFFGRYWIKRMDGYFTQPLPAELAQTTDPLKRQLLGLDLMPGTPSYHGDDEGYNRRGEPGIDYVP